MKTPTLIAATAFILLFGGMAAFAQHGGCGGGGNNHGNDDHGGMGMGGNCDSLQEVTKSGTVIIDTANCFMGQYFLDTDGDSKADYQLNFGPPWYKPSSGATRPDNGDKVTVTGGLMTYMTPEGICVWELDGKTWRDSTHTWGWSGGWVGGMHSGDTTRIYHHRDSTSWCDFPDSSWGMGMGMGHQGGRRDSVYCRYDDADTLPGWHGGGHGFTVEVYEARGSRMMGGMHSNSMSFKRDVRIRFHYTDEEIAGMGGHEGDVVVMCYDNGQWKPAPNQNLDTDANVVTVTSSKVFPFYVLTVATPTGISDVSLPNSVQLDQNYPNPFNPSTSIRFYLDKQSNIQLLVYDALGRQVSVVAQGVYTEGEHQVVFNAAGLPSGVYLYRLINGNEIVTRRMVLNK